MNTTRYIRENKKAKYYLLSAKERHTHTHTHTRARARTHIWVLYTFKIVEHLSNTFNSILYRK